MRLALVALIGVFGFFGVTFTLAQVTVNRNPALAYRLAPYDGRITAAYATSLAGPEATLQDRALADGLAKRALRLDPTAVGALATLGVNADVRGDGGSRRYFAYAQKLSRRDFRTQLFMIEDAVQRGDIADALHQYDMTLRVLPELSDILYPVLTSASSDPAIRRDLVRTLAGKPVWAESFINFTADNSTDPKSAAALFVNLRRVGVVVPDTAQAGIVNVLVNARDYDAAWSYYALIRPGADRRRSRDPRFSAGLKSPSKLDWTPVNDESGLIAGIQNGIFDFAAPASVGGPMLQQMQLLPRGTYRLSGHSLGIEQAAGALPYWALRCMDGRELGRIEMPTSNTAKGNFTGTFSVPADCPSQILILTARPSDAVAGLSGRFDRVELVPAL